MRLLLIAFMLITLQGCVPTTRTVVTDVRAPLSQVMLDRAHKAMTLALLDAGFDLKQQDPALRIVMTEYKKVDSVSGWPPFDFYLQIKAVVRDIPGSQDGELAIWPKMKEQNRLNQNAFTEHPLIWYSQQETDDSNQLSARAEAMRKGQALFQSFLQSVADRLGLPVDALHHSTKPLDVLGM